MYESPYDNSTGELGKENNPFDITLGFFEGPLDLLLHLIHSEEVEIERVEMAKIADQYLAIVSRYAHSLDLDRASEYLVIAAHLIAIKSKFVLPRHEVGVDTEDLDIEESSNYYEQLRERLQQYEIMKKRAIALNNRQQLGIETFVKISELSRFVVDALEPAAEKPGTLALLFMKVLQRIGVNAPKLKIKLEPVSVVDFMSKIVLNFRKNADGGGKRNFYGLVKVFCGGRRFFEGQTVTAQNKVEQPTGVVIATFIGVLELVRRGFLHVAQTDSNSEIEIELKENSVVELDKLEAELEQMRQLEQKYTQGQNIGLPEFSASKVVNIEDYRQEQTAEVEPQDLEKLADIEKVGNSG